MQVKATSRGFRFIEHPMYPPDGSSGAVVRESSAIGDYHDSFNSPGSSYLWVGDNHHLNREEVANLIEHMQDWLKYGRIPEPSDNMRQDQSND